MVAIEQKCIKCGRIFLRGIYPQKRCDVCSMKDSHVYTTEGHFINAVKQ